MFKSVTYILRRINLAHSADADMTPGAVRWKDGEGGFEANDVANWLCSVVYKVIGKFC